MVTTPSGYENYTGIVFDTDENKFSVVTGPFRDKKDMYDKMTSADKYLRRAYEAKIWDWIQKNAQTPIDSYLMMSTAVSKWINNNILSKYYKKLLHDLPYLNREGRKGDPQTMGIDNVNFGESVLTEDDWSIEKRDEEEKRRENDLKDTGNWEKHKVTAYPLDKEGNRIEDCKPIIFPVAGFDKARLENAETPAEKVAASDEVIAGLFRWSKDETNPYRWAQKYEIVFDDNASDAITVQKTQINSRYRTTNANVSKRAEQRKTEVIGKRINRVSNLLYSAFAPRVVTEQGDVIGILRLDSKGNYQDLVRKDNLNSKIAIVKKNSDHQGKIELLRQLFKRDSNNKVVDIVYEKLGEIVRDKIYLNNGTALTIERTGDEDLINEYLQPLKNAFGAANAEEHVSDKQMEMVLNRLKNELSAASTSNEVKGSEHHRAINAIRTELEDLYQDIASENNRKLKKTPDEKRYGANKPIDFGNPVFNSTAFDTHASQIDRQMRIQDRNPDLTDPAKDSVKNQKVSSTSLVGKSQLGQYFKNPDPINTPNYDKALAVMPTVYPGISKEAMLSAINKLGIDYGEDKYPNIYFDKHPDELMQVFDKVYPGLQKQKEDLEKQLSTVEKNSDEELELKDQLYKLTGDKSLLDKNESVNEAVPHVNDGADAVMDYVDSHAQVQGSILEANTNSELDDRLWDISTDHLKPEIRDALLQIATKFKETLKVPFEPVDIYFTGSEANYNYNEDSDIDVHLVYDFEEAGVAAEIVSEYLKSAKNLFNGKYSITVKNIPVEVGAENVAEPLVTTGVYSLVKDEWLLHPENANTEIPEVNDIIYNEVKNQLERVVNSHDSEEIKAFIELLSKMRKTALANEGEFGAGNLLFKKLRGEGLLGKLRQAYYDTESNDLSLESVFEESDFMTKDEAKKNYKDALLKQTTEINDMLNKEPSTGTDAFSEDNNVPTDGFSSVCKKLAKEALENITEEDKTLWTRQAGIKRDGYNVDEFVAACYNGIHPNIIQNKVKLVNPEDKSFVQLLRISKDYQKVEVLKYKFEKDKYGRYAILPVRNADGKSTSEVIPMQEFLEIMNNPANTEKVKEAWGKDWGMDLTDLVSNIEHKASDYNQGFDKWYEQNKDEYDLDMYDPIDRQRMYKTLQTKRYRLRDLLPFYRTSEEKRSSKLKTGPYTVIRDLSDVDESVLTEKYYDVNGNEIKTSETSKESFIRTDPSAIRYCLYNNDIDPAFEQATFYDRTEQNNLNVDEEDKPHTKAYKIVGIPANIDLERVQTFFVKEFLPLQNKVNKANKNSYRPSTDVRETTADRLKEMIVSSSKNEKSEVEDRVFQTMLDPTGYRNTNIKDATGTWETLRDEEIEQVLTIMAKNEEGKSLWKKYKNALAHWNEGFRDNALILDAIKNFDPKFNGEDGIPFFRRFGDKIKIFVPMLNRERVTVYGNPSKYDDLMRK